MMRNDTSVPVLSSSYPIIRASLVIGTRACFASIIKGTGVNRTNLSYLASIGYEETVN
jgi:hypothetical protein